jgi:hypothetical protein
MTDAQKLKVKRDQERKEFLKNVKNKGPKIWGEK